MITKLSAVSILVRDQDEALRWYTEKLGFEKRDDNSATVPGYRWLTVAPKAQKELMIVLGKPKSEEAMQQVGRQTGPKGNPETTWVFETDDCRKTCEELKGKGVRVLGEPVERPYGVEVGFEDLYGNVFWIIEPWQAETGPAEKKTVMAEA